MVLLDGNGKPKVFQHESSFLKKGKMMDYETLHTFATECIVKEYCNRKYEAINTSNQEEETCDFVFKMPSGRTICCKIVLTEESFPEVIAKTDLTSLFNYCRKVKGYPRLYTVAAWCFSTPEGSKMIHGGSFAFKVNSISLLDKDDVPVEQVLSEESLIKTFADAWNERDTSPLKSILSNHVHYSSSFIFDEIRGKIETIAYLDDIFKRIKVSNGKSLLSLCKSRETGELMLADTTKGGLFFFMFEDSKITDIRLSPLERSQVEYLAFEETPPPVSDLQEESFVVTSDEIVASPSQIANGVVVDESPIKGTQKIEASDYSVQQEMPASSVPNQDDIPINKPSVSATPESSIINTTKTSNNSPVSKEATQAPVASKRTHRTGSRKWLIIGLSYLLSLIICTCASFLYMRIAIEESKDDIRSQVDILPSNKRILYFSDEHGSLQYTKSENVPSGDFYKAVKSFYTTKKKGYWYFRAMEQTTPTSFIYTEYTPYAVGFHTESGTGIDQKFNELKSNLRSYLRESAVLSDNNGYYMNAMLNAESRYHSIIREADNSDFPEWKYGNETSQYELYYRKECWKCSVSEKKDAIRRDFFIYTGVLFIIVSIIMAIIIMALPSLRSKTKV